jgi:GntR family transcriptional regulator of vanillate catabolism
MNLPAMVWLREMILRNELTAGELVDATTLAKRTGLPSTALRQALAALSEEGLLVAAGVSSYSVASWSEQELGDAIDVRAALEGLAARKVAESGASVSLLGELRECLRAGDLIFQKKQLIGAGDKAIYADMNLRFHELIVHEAGSAILSDALARNRRLPFAGPHAIAFERPDPARAYEILAYAHRQHHAIIDALENGQGQRADILMREHVSPVKEALHIRKLRSDATESSRPVSFIQANAGRHAGRHGR